MVTQRFEERECISFELSGQKMFGILHRPLSVKAAPAVLFCHGFAGNKSGRYRIYVSLAEKLAQNGIASLRFDFRGSGDSEGDFHSMTINSEVEDTLLGLKILRKTAGIDNQRIGVLGNSFGGAIAVLTAHRDRHVKSLALLAPLFNSESWRMRWHSLTEGMTPEASQQAISKTLGGQAPGKAFYPDFFQLNLEPALKDLEATPLLHVHSVRDERVTIDHAKHYEACRQEASADTRWIRLQECDHDFADLKERSLVIEEVSKWFKETL